MSAPAFRLQAPRKPVLPDSDTSETRFWKQLKAPLLIKENNAVNHIHFNPSSPHDLALTSSTRIQILSAKTQQVQKTIAKFKDTVYSGEFRPDGRLLVAGDGTGMIQCFDTNTKSVLVTLKPTSHPVHVTKFHPTSMSTMLSASDDRVVRLWDLTSSDPLLEIANQHHDYIRTASFMGSRNMIVTGCYDGYVRLFDPRSPQVVAEFNQHNPVESVLPLNESTLASCGGPEVKIWDITAGKKIKQLGNFQKTVTTLASAGEHCSGGFLAGSLDGHVKLFDTTSTQFPVKFGWKYGGPVLATGMSPDMRQLAAGLTTGLMSVRTRKTDPRKPRTQKKERTETMARVMRGMEYQGELESQTIKIAHKPQSSLKLKQYEKHIRAFRWADALDSAFKQGVAIDQTLMVLEELRSRGKISVSLANRDETQLEPLLRWCVRYISDPRLVSLASDWVGTVLELYSSVIENSLVLASLVEQLSGKVKSQVERAKDAQSIEGMLELLMA